MAGKRKAGRLVVIVIALCALSSGAFAGDIIEAATRQGELGTFLMAVEAAGLTEMLKSSQTFTVFAPTDQAFRRLPRRTMQRLMDPANKDKLAAILKYHLVSGDTSAYELGRMRNGTTLTTFGGGKVEVTHNRSGIFINGAKIVMTDIRASNGVIHIIDAVLLPEKK